MIIARSSAARLGSPLHRRCIRRDIVPFRVVRRWREWECNAGKVVRDTRLNLLPGIQLSNEKQFCFGVGKHIGCGFFAFTVGYRATVVWPAIQIAISVMKK